jgi:hypothetical protein
MVWSIRKIFRSCFGYDESFRLRFLISWSEEKVRKSKIWESKEVDDLLLIWLIVVGFVLTSYFDLFADATRTPFVPSSFRTIWTCLITVWRSWTFLKIFLRSLSIHDLIPRKCLERCNDQHGFKFKGYFSLWGIKSTYSHDIDS